MRQVKRLQAALVAMSLAGAAAGAFAVVPARPAAAAGPPVFLVGDSVMQVFRFSYGKPGLAEVEKGYTVDLDAFQCRRLITTGCKPDLRAQQSALDVMRLPEHNPLPPVMVMTVGHNEKDDYPNKINVIMQEAKARGVKTVVWLTYHNSIRATAYPGNNAAVKDGATRWPEMKVADWDAHAQGHANWFSTEDGLHLTPEGAIEYGKFIKNAIDTLAGTGPPRPPPAKCDPATAIGTPAPGLSNQPPNPPAAGARITSMTPVRLLDTRAEGPDDGVVGRLGGGRALNIVVAGKVGVPANATGVIANVTAVEPCDGGFLTVYPAGSPPPLASSTNYRTSDVVAALVTVRLGTGGAISVYSNAQTDVVVDVVGYFHANQGTLFNAVDPFRLVDTRPTGLGAGQELRVPVRGVAPIPAGTGVAGAVLNLTVTEPAADGFLTVYPGPCNPANRPLTSNVNFVKGQTVANLVVAALGTDGSVCVFSNTSSQIVVDAAGWLAGSGAGMFGVTPQRLVDTRAGSPALHNTVKGRLTPFVPFVVPAGTSSGIPADATAAVLEVVAIGSTQPGYLTAYPCGSTPPLASNVNYAAGEVRPNLVAVRIGADDSVCLISQQAVDVVVDLGGWFK
jgi:hypothetical protein